MPTGLGGTPHDEEPPRAGRGLWYASTPRLLQPTKGLFMLRANVNVSRKISENYNSTGFGISLEGEIQATLDDPQGVIERIKELYDLAEEALDQQVERHQSDSAVADRDRDQPGPERNGHHANGSANGHAPSRNGHSSGNGEPASNKQVQYLQTLAKRQKLFGAKLEGYIEEVIGRKCGPYDLTKKEAGAVIDALNPEGAGNNNSRR